MITLPFAGAPPVRSQKWPVMSDVAVSWTSEYPTTSGVCCATCSITGAPEALMSIASTRSLTTSAGRSASFTISLRQPTAFAVGCIPSPSNDLPSGVQ